MSEADPREMFQQVPWPFPDGAFPADLGAVVQRTVLWGRSPARLVIHDDEGNWVVGDGRTDPNRPGACEVAHIIHVVAQNSSLVELVDLPPGWQARRRRPGRPWRRSRHVYEP